MLLLDYYVKTSAIKNGPGFWDYTLCEIYKGDGKIGDVKVGEYKRNYGAFGTSTFFAFTFNNKEYALYSPDYQMIKLMSLPDCKDIPLKEECVKQMEHFCPTELYVPMWSNTTYDYKKQDGTLEKHNMQSWINTLEREKNDKYEYNYGYCSIAFALGCVWGDDSSSKLIIIDLRKIEEGELWFINNKLEQKWLYEEFPDSVNLKDVEVEFEDDEFTTFPSGYKQLKQEYVWW